jgi:hypothetical protein
MMPATGLADDSGYKSASGYNDNSGVSNPDRAYSSNDSRASFSDGEHVDYTFGNLVPADATVTGITVGAGSVGYADALAEVTPTVNAGIGQNAQITCGYQALGGNPVLSFFSGSELTGSPTLTFTVKSIEMSGNPTLHFAAGNAAEGYDTVTRNDSGTWSGDGFKTGDYISISGTDQNNAVYQIKDISIDGKTITLDTKGIVKAEDKSGANVYIERAGEITTVRAVGLTMTLLKANSSWWQEQATMMAIMKLAVY